MSERHKLFVSFANDDNAAKDSSKGWVETFAQYLSVFVERINNQSPEFEMMDEKSKRPGALGDSDGIIIIASDSYISNNLAKKDAALLADPNRVFKVDLSPLHKSDQPSEIRLLNEYHFYAARPGGENFDTLTGEEEDPDYWLEMIDLAFDINRSLYQKSDQVGNGKTVYLAETSYDQVHNRDEIKRELIRHGYDVLPKFPFPSDLKEFEKEVLQCIENSDLSVHIIGESYGDVPSGSDKSMVEIQNQLSTEYFAKSLEKEQALLHRLIWMPLSLKARSDKQKLYLDQLRDDISSTAGAEIIQTPLEILKTIIHSRLRMFDAEKRIEQQRTMQRSDQKVVYLLFDKKDEKEVGGMVKDIESKNIEVIVPSFNDSKMEFLESHRQSLVRSDGVLLFANKNLNWVNSKLNDVIKAPGFGKQFPFDAKGIYIKDQSIQKEKLAAFGDLVMLNGKGKSSSPDISQFLDKIVSP